MLFFFFFFLLLILFSFLRLIDLRLVVERHKSHAVHLVYAPSYRLYLHSAYKFRYIARSCCCIYSSPSSSSSSCFFFSICYFGKLVRIRIFQIYNRIWFGCSRRSCSCYFVCAHCSMFFINDTKKANLIWIEIECGCGCKEMTYSHSRSVGTKSTHYTFWTCIRLNARPGSSRYSSTLICIHYTTKLDCISS